MTGLMTFTWISQFRCINVRLSHNLRELMSEYISLTLEYFFLFNVRFY